MMLLRSYRLLLLSMVLGVAGCSLLPQAPLYQLDGGTLKAPSARTGVVLLLGPLTLAQYLQREVILQRQTDGSLTETDAHWAGSLQEDIDHLLQRQLASRLHTPYVLSTASSGLPADAQLLVTISRLDSGPQQPAVLHAQWRLLDKNGQLREQRLLQLEQTHSDSLASQVQAQSRLLQQLAEQLAVDVSEFSRQSAGNASGTRPVPPLPRKSVPTPKPPTTPATGAAEVYRF
ncbi:MAG: hypothetical protein A2Y50_10775 [Pseudomonadales bacterium RIFCSPLOWO2_12_59_9]|nr:MAG: hypothetical protein A2Y50_10775 [Pseudomonadales bacterium RIFCSPLOWO2_12_59_9]